MFTHVVCFKLKDRSPEAIEVTRQVLANMEGKIPQLRYIEVGTDVLRSDRSYDLVLITKFDSQADMEAYQVHPAHLEVGAHMKQVLDGTSVAVDFVG
ncbi:Dabb family protein [Paenibacillus sp. N1-5-1-14]|uniref:Dabb family protein n=1 Tax=Paenibacillus radicibacter TaxID=2972488 RepID=UPI0021598B21|nr:Dabb family protein [Paenibacillus radicibacter]MCR8641357.1 Dabb family protein [Paenibacillus radicibacter]